MKYNLFLTNGENMEHLAIIIQTALTTISVLATLTTGWFVLQTNKLRTQAKTLTQDLATAHNANQNTIENLIAKMADLETQIAMTRSTQFKRNI